MVSPGSSIKILLVRPWIHPLAPLREALRTAGVAARFTRVDIEPALNAALARGGFDVVVLDPTIPGMSPLVIEARMREHHVDIPIVELGDIATLVARIKQAIVARRC
jgi:DNA-binding NtrC family response regulator